jgi:MFS family permease
MNKWVALGVGMLMALVSGQLYAFGGYEKKLKERMHFEQIEVQRIGMVLDAGVTLAQPITGWIFDTCGPCVSASGAAVAASIGYLCVYGAIKNASGSFLMAIGFFLVGFASALGYITALSTNCRNFSDKNRGAVVGFLAGGFGLSAFVMSWSYLMFFSSSDSSDISSFFLFWAVGLGTTYSLGACCVRSAKSPRESSYSKVTFSNDEYDPEPQPSMGMVQNLMQLIAHRKFWFLYIPFLLGTGGGLFLVNNFGTMIESVDGTANSSRAQHLVMTYSVCNFSGRLIVGFLADRTSYRRGHLVLGCLILLTLAHAMSAMIYHMGSGVLFLTATLVGTGYGGLWCLMPTIVSEQWGLNNFGECRLISHNYDSALLAQLCTVKFS